VTVVGSGVTAWVLSNQLQIAGALSPIQQPVVPTITNQPVDLGGKPFVIGFDGSTLSGQLAIRSVRDIERLIRVLQAQKVAFEAMEEDGFDETNEPD
jgi:hypothetical protein